MSISQERQRLLHRIGRRYQTVTETVELGRLRFAFTRIADPDRVLDEVAAEADLRDRLNGRRAGGDELHLPYWAELWDSAWGIGKYLEGSGSNSESPNPRIPESSPKTEFRIPKEDSPGSLRLCSTISSFGIRAFGIDSGIREFGLRNSNLNPVSRILDSLSVLDLGCGMGLAGTVAAGLGAHVVFADLESPALLFARLNSLPWRRRVQTRRLNWQSDHMDRRFDVILGADILYERVQWPWLNTFWRAHLADGGQVILGEPGRQTGDLFIDWIVGQGWRLQVREIAVASRPRAIRIFLIS